MPDLVVAGAGMAGLAAAARAVDLGASVDVYEKGSRPGGSMLLSSGFLWRHREFDTFRAECPGGDPELQRLVHGRLDGALDWLERLGAPVEERETGNPLTVGRRFNPRALTELLVARGGPVRVGEPLHELPDGVPVVLATGGFQGDRALLREHVTPEADHLLVRANPWSCGDGLRLGLAAGASLSEGMGEFYGRNMPAPPAVVEPEDYVRLAQLYAHHAEVLGASGERFVTRTWSEIDAVQWTARQPGARARYVVRDDALNERVRERTVGDMIAAAEAAGAPVERRDGVTIVEVMAAITTTLGGLRVDASAQAADGVYAAGADAGGVATGGYSSGLAAALVFGIVAAEAALA
jgi:succinate dehydrogenase/fumarate reductase flavoprotein subunit